MRKHLISALSVTMTVMALVLVSSSPAAASQPQFNHGLGGILSLFKTCPNPGGTQIAGYAEGRHQIPGGGLMSGSDYVYRVGHNIFVQCFCPPDNSGNSTGIQSNWIHEGNLTAAQEQQLISQGWMRIENGTQWGLPAGSYLVKNLSFRCGGVGGVPCYPGTDGNHKDISYQKNVQVIQRNHAVIDTKVNVQMNTGFNQGNQNVGGPVHVSSGDTESHVNITTKANVNVAHVEANDSERFWSRNLGSGMNFRSIFNR